MIRTGTCNRCGECCTGEQGYPVPKNYPGVVRNWLVADITHLAHLSIVGLGERPDGGLEVVSDTFDFNLAGHKVEGIWVPGHGLCTNLAPLDDEGVYETVCPFLEDEKFGRRECSLAGTAYEDWYLNTCGDMAPEVFTQAEVDEWFALNPSCSYGWA